MEMMARDKLPNGSWSTEANTAESSPCRKRKRRQRSGGAIEDCFTCRTRAIKCDRKRPYCTQCVEIGKECSGYKTTLTWGVGIASRGKLRGLTCPVATKGADGGDISHAEHSNPASKRRRTSSVSTVTRSTETSNVSLAISQPESLSELEAMSMPSNYPASTYAEDVQPFMNTSGFHDHVFSVESGARRRVGLDHPTLQNLESAIASYNHLDVPNSGYSTGSYTEQEFYSPMNHSFASTPLPPYESLPPTTSDLYSALPITTISSEDLGGNSGTMDTFDHSLSQAVDYMHNPQSFPGDREVPAEQIAGSSFNNSLLNQADRALLPYDTFEPSNAQPYERDPPNEQSKAHSFDTRFCRPFCHISPRLQSWMDYYDRNICPYLVAFDGGENPYRKHVLQLALNNEGLQHAIAALSANNLRMRKRDLRRSGFTNEIVDAFRGTTSSELNEPSTEELCYKQMSIDQLNLQLSDKRAAQDDSVLATLLILCLFHACDSGFSKFKAQLAGVQTLLALREPQTESDFTRWIQMFFTWFDVMTSAVNDREMQISGDSMDMLDFNSNLGAMEQFSGCDGKLFKLIARLGRLNLLAQGRPVRSKNGGQQVQRSPYDPTTSQQPRKRKSDPSQAFGFQFLRSQDYVYTNVDGSGTPVISSDEESNMSSYGNHVAGSDDRDEFWAEWWDIRSRLQSFQLDLPNIPSATSPNVPSDPAELKAGQRDMIHINESFRCSALLYTERLGHPLRPSSHRSFQSLVCEALYHITALAIDSCVNKFLLWPLFIIGTECVDERHRDIIRRRCIEVQKESGFYNNISSLEVLERVWMEASGNVYRDEAEEVRIRRRDSETGRCGRYGQAFRWRKAMDRVDGEYIVV